MLTTLTALCLAAAAPATSPHDALWAMFSQEWDWTAANYPEDATQNGDERFNDKLTDMSQEAIEHRKAHVRELLARAKAFDRGALGAEDRLDLDLFLYPLQQNVDGQRFPEDFLQLNQIDSPPARFAQLARAIPKAHVQDYRYFLARLRQIPKNLEQRTALLRQGLAAGVTPPKITLREVPKLLAAHADPDPEKNPLYQAAFADMPASISAEDQAKLRAEAKDVLKTLVIPAYRKLADFAFQSYLPGARESLAASMLPDGEAWYRHDIAVQTTTDMTAEQIHALGLSEVARLDKALDELRAKVGFKGSRKAFFKFMKTDKRFFYKDGAALVTGYRDIAKRIDPQLPLHFRTLPRLTYGVEAMPAYEAKSAPTAFYEPGAPETGRAGTFMANTYDLAARPKWAMEDLTLHEGVPGHHLQIALGQELYGLPRFRRFAYYNAFGEGWALYSESLGDELGMFKDPYSKFGQLSAEMWRAVRLVVDTGLHAKGWTRDQAIAFFAEHTGQSDLNVKVEVDRYIVWPAQALGYKIGELQIKRLRAKAEAELGQSFEERDFHDAVLGAGGVPLAILETRINDWIAAQKQGAAAPAAPQSR